MEDSTTYLRALIDIKKFFFLSFIKYKLDKSLITRWMGEIGRGFCPNI